jgi:hypothetical protein
VESARYGRWAGLWLTTEEAAADMVQITEDGEQPVTMESVSEGHILRDSANPAGVFEVLLYDHVRDLVFLTEI